MNIHYPQNGRDRLESKGEVYGNISRCGRKESLCITTTLQELVPVKATISTIVQPAKLSQIRIEHVCRNVFFCFS